MSNKEDEEMGIAIARLKVAEAKLAEAANNAAGTEFNVKVRPTCNAAFSIEVYNFVCIYIYPYIYGLI